MSENEIEDESEDEIENESENEIENESENGSENEIEVGSESRRKSRRGLASRRKSRWDLWCRGRAHVFQGWDVLVRGAGGGVRVERQGRGVKGDT